MYSGQTRVVLVSIALAESAWFYAVFAMIGLAFGLGASPLNMPAVLAVLGSSILVTRAAQTIAMPDRIAYSGQFLVALTVIIVTVATQVGEDGPAPRWLLSLAARDPGRDFAVTAILGGLLSVLLWRRGAQVATHPSPVQTLGTSFRLGVVAMAVAALVDTVVEADLNIYPIMFLFLGASLAGLGIGRLLPASEETAQSQAWPRLIGGVVGVVVLFGLFLGLLQNLFLSQASRLSLFGLGLLVDRVVKYLLFAVLYPLAFLVGLVVDAIVRIFRVDERREAPDQAQETAPIDTFLEQLRERTSDSDAGSSVLLDVFEYAVIAILVMVVLFFLARAFRRRRRLRLVYEAGVRESVEARSTPALDLAKLLFRFLPARLRGSGKAGRYRLPEGPAGVVDVFRIYYGLLELGKSRGIDRSPSETPHEFQAKLESVLPRDLVTRATEAFCRACYGYRPAAANVISELRESLEREKLSGAQA